MNLILSDVEETIMILDQVEGAPDGQATVNVSTTHFSATFLRLDISIL